MFIRFIPYSTKSITWYIKVDIGYDFLITRNRCFVGMCAKFLPLCSFILHVVLCLWKTFHIESSTFSRKRFDMRVKKETSFYKHILVTGLLIYFCFYFRHSLFLVFRCWCERETYLKGIYYSTDFRGYAIRLPIINFKINCTQLKLAR